MNEKKKLFLILGVLAVLVISLVGVGIATSIKQKKLYTDFLDKFNGSTNTLVYIGRPTCGYCNLLSPSLESLQKHYGFNYIYVNIDEVSDGIFSDIKEKLNLTEVGTPYLAIVSNGGVVDTQSGYVDMDQLFAFLQKNSIIASDAKMLIDYIDYDTFKTNLASDKLSVTVFGKGDCIHCIHAKSTLNDIITKNDIKINYISLNYILETEFNELNTLLTATFGEWGTPSTIITKNGKVVDSLSGAANEEGFMEFFKKNGVL